MRGGWRGKALQLFGAFLSADIGLMDWREGKIGRAVLLFVASAIIVLSEGWSLWQRYWKGRRVKGH